MPSLMQLDLPWYSFCDSKQLNFFLFPSKQVSLTANASEKEARLNDSEAELARCRATCNRFTQVRIES